MRALQTFLAAVTANLLLAAPGAAALAPLPDAPVVLRITDVPAFDRALSGGFRKALSGKLPDSDPAASAWKRTRVGGKLDAQWALFAADLPLSWPDILSLRPTEIAFTLLSAGDLEAVMADYARILEIRPGWGTALYCRAATLSRTGRFTDALVDLAAAIDADAGLKATAVRDDDFPDLAADPVCGAAYRAIVGEG